MNKQLQAKRFNIAMNVMRRAAAAGDEHFNIRTWQSRSWTQGTATKEEELHECNTTACFSGWMAVAKDVHAEGAFMGANKAMIMRNSRGNPMDPEDSMMEFLGTTLNESLSLISPAWYSCGNPNAYDVLDKLYKLADNYGIGEMIDAKP